MPNPAPDIRLAGYPVGPYSQFHLMAGESKHSVLETNKFYATTIISGFSFIHGSKTKKERIFWYGITALFVCFTLISMYRLIVQYLSFKTLTLVSILHSPHQLELSTFHLRLQIYLPEFHPEFENSSVKTLYPNSYNGSTLMEELEESFLKLDTADKLLNSDWDYAFLPPLARYFVLLSACEVATEMSSSNLMNPSSAIFEAKRFPIDKAIESIFNHSRSLDVTVRQMADKIGDEVRRWTGLSALAYSPETYITYEPLWEHWTMRLYSILSFGMDGSVDLFYLAKPKQPLHYTTQQTQMDFVVHFAYDKLIQLVWNRGLFGDNSSLNQAKTWYESFEPAIMLYIGEMTSTATPSITFQPGRWNYWSLKLVAQSNSIKGCNKHNNMYDLFMSCASDIHEQICKCTPVFLKSLQNKEPSSAYCTANQEMSCIKDASEGILLDKSKACLTRTQINCNRDTYEFAMMESLSVESVAAMYGIEISGAAASLHLTSSVFTLFQEEYAQSFMSFLGELGGTFEFWIGASVIGVIHLGLYLGKQCYYRAQGGNKIKASTDQDSELREEMRKEIKRYCGDMMQEMKERLETIDSEILKLRQQSAIREHEETVSL